MSVTLGRDGSIVLAGACGQEDAELLVQHLTAAPAASIDWTQCTAAHTAVVQVLLTARPEVRGPPASADLARWVAPMLAGRSP